MKIREVDRQFRLARIWSNRELAKVSHLFEGDVVNVSAGEDEDKEGGTYAAYFPNSHGYYITNYNPGSFRGYQGRENEFLVDLTKDLPNELIGRFDIVYNHTTLEHVFEVTTAFSNICRLSRDVVILVVPFAQVQHENNAYEDFWRLTPTCVRRLFEINGMHVIYEAANNYENAAVYLFTVASRSPEKWVGKIPGYEPVYPAGEWIGRSTSEYDKHRSKSMASRLVGDTRRRLRKMLSMVGS